MTDRVNVYVFVVEYFMREAPSCCLVAFFVLQLNYTTFAGGLQVRKIQNERDEGGI